MSIDEEINKEWLPENVLCVSDGGQKKTESKNITVNQCDIYG